VIGLDVVDGYAAELLELGTATLYEASGDPCCLPATLRPVWDTAVVGRALPVRTAAGDNLPLHLALEQAEPGDVLVVDAAGAAHGYWGEVLTVAAQARGVRGLVIDGGVRDTGRLRELGFPVFSSSVALTGTGKSDAGSIGAPIRMGAATVRRGDVVVGDADGVVALRGERLTEIVAASRSRAAAEAAYLERLRAGELTLDIYGFRRAADRP
jgi:4-hydroxy-4-methyl-2-oxoglutarate aldolase